jgi:hypothetical protein
MLLKPMHAQCTSLQARAYSIAELHFTVVLNYERYETNVELFCEIILVTCNLFGSVLLQQTHKAETTQF